MANYDYEIVNGRKIRVRPKETVSEIDKNGYFRRQPNHFTTPFGDGENDLKAEGNIPLAIPVIDEDTLPQLGCPATPNLCLCDVPIVNF